VTKLPVISAKKLERFLFISGFNKIRQKGSHVFYKHPDGRTTTIPHHKGKVLTRPLIRTILREINVDLDTFNRNM
jgi:predicted RNA binding protein YcfA (HicA-like mRNA interferase family)